MLIISLVMTSLLPHSMKVVNAEGGGLVTVEPSYKEGVDGEFLIGERLDITFGGEVIHTPNGYSSYYLYLEEPDGNVRPMGGHTRYSVEPTKVYINVNKEGSHTFKYYHYIPLGNWQQSEELVDTVTIEVKYAEPKISVSPIIIAPGENVVIEWSGGTPYNDYEWAFWNVRYDTVGLFRVGGDWCTLEDTDNWISGSQWAKRPMREGPMEVTTRGDMAEGEYVVAYLSWYLPNATSSNRGYVTGNTIIVTRDPENYQPPNPDGGSSGGGTGTGDGGGTGTGDGGGTGTGDGGGTGTGDSGFGGGESGGGGAGGGTGDSGSGTGDSGSGTGDSGSGTGNGGGSGDSGSGDDPGDQPPQNEEDEDEQIFVATPEDVKLGEAIKVTYKLKTQPTGDHQIYMYMHTEYDPVTGQMANLVELERVNVSGKSGQVMMTPDQEKLYQDRPTEISFILGQGSAPIAYSNRVFVHPESWIEVTTGSEEYKVKVGDPITVSWGGCPGWLTDSLNLYYENKPLLPVESILNPGKSGTKEFIITEPGIYEVAYNSMGLPSPYSIHTRTVEVVEAKKILDVPLYTQVNDQTCWAASASMISSYFNGDTLDRQRAFAQDLHGDFMNGGGDITTSGYFITSTTGKAGKVSTGALSFEDVKKQIEAEMPIYVTMRPTVGSGGHAMVIIGYEDDRINDKQYVYIADPGDGVMHKKIYSEFVEGNGEHWGATLRFHDVITGSPELLIFIPGIGGTTLAKADNEGKVQKFWPPKVSNIFGDIDAVRFNADGIPMAHADTLFPMSGFYMEICKKMAYPEILGTVLEQEAMKNYVVIPFGYDWRMDNTTNVARLTSFIDQKMAETGATKVSIVGHSMGGLITSKYIANGNAHKVNKIVTLGTPYLGAPLTSHVGNTGRLLEGIAGMVIGGIVKGLVINYPAFYQLMPSRNYFEFNNTHYIRKEVPGDWEASGDVNDYDETMWLFRNTNHLFNPTMVNGAMAFGTSLETVLDTTPLSEVDAYFIIGDASPTIGEVIEEYSRNSEGKLVFSKQKDINFINGDGTVPLISANIGGYASYKPEKVYYSTKKHSDLPGDQLVIKQAIAILGDRSELHALSNTPTSVGNTLKLKVECPVDIHVYDSEGNHTGINPDGIIEENIPRSGYFVLDGDAKVIALNSANYEIVLKGTGHGTMKYTIEEYGPNYGAVEKTIIFEDVPLTPTTVITSDTDIANNIVLNIDTDGNGIVDSVIQPTIVENGTQPDEAKPVQVDLSSYYNNDVFSYATNRADGDFGNTLWSLPSSMVPETGLTHEGATYTFGSTADGQKNAVGSLGQTIAIPQGAYDSIRLLGNAVYGDKTQTFRINYSDGTYTDVQNVVFKDYATTNTTGQNIALQSSYRHRRNIGQENVPVYIFANSLTPETGKTVTGITLPNNSAVRIYAVTGVSGTTSTHVGLSSYYTVDAFTNEGNYTDTNFVAHYAYAAEALESSEHYNSESNTLSYDGISYKLGSRDAGENNAIYSNGQTVVVPVGQYKSIKVLGARLYNGGQTTYRINYTDGTYENVVMEPWKDWCITNTTGQKVALTMPYRYTSWNSTQTADTQIFAYDINVNILKNVASVTLPVDVHKEIIAMTLIPVDGMPVAGNGTGLKGEYYDNTGFTRYMFTRIDEKVDFNWGQGSPDASMGVDTFTIRWTGEVEAVYSAPYTFHTTSDDGIRLWVNDVLVIDQWTAGGSYDSPTIDLVAGERYNIKVEYVENYGSAHVKLMWSSPYQAKVVIPTSQLYPSTEPTNLVGNPGFEHQNAGWSNWGNSEVVTDHVHHGTYALRIGTGGGGRVQDIRTDIEEGSSYVLSGWGKVGASGETGLTRIRFYDASNNQLSLNAIEYTETEYTYKELPVTAPTGTSYAQIFIWKNAGIGSYFYVDDIELIKQ